MLVGVATLPLSFPPSGTYLGILVHKQATLGKHFEPECTLFYYVVATVFPTFGNDLQNGDNICWWNWPFVVGLVVGQEIVE